MQFAARQRDRALIGYPPEDRAPTADDSTRLKTIHTRLPEGHRYSNPRMIHRNCGAAKSVRTPACTGDCPGRELTAIFKALGATPIQGCDCAKLARQMDAWKVAGCEEHRDEILARLSKNYKQFSLTDKMKAAILAWPAGVALKIKWSDPLPGLLDLALSRSKLAAEKPDNGGGGQSDAG